MKPAIVVLLIFIGHLSFSQIPGTLSYQGILMQSDGITPLVDGAHTIVFNFDNVSTVDDPALFSRTVSVTTTKGLFTCIIGGGTGANAPFDATEISQLGNQQIFIGIKVDGAANELSPRAQLTSVAYAFQAQSIIDGAVSNAKIASGVDASKLIGTMGGSTSINTTGTVTATSFSGFGTVPIGAILDWWRPNSSFSVPAGFKICDGSVISDAASPYNGTTSPNLLDKFVRGVTNVANIGTAGGSTSTSSDSHRHIWSYYNGSDWVSYDSSGGVINMTNYGDGLDMAGSGYYPMYSMTSATFFYTTSDSHSHTLTPPFVGLLKIMRIK